MFLYSHSKQKENAGLEEKKTGGMERKNDKLKLKKFNYPPTCAGVSEIEKRWSSLEMIVFDLIRFLIGLCKKPSFQIIP